MTDKRPSRPKESDGQPKRPTIGLLAYGPADPNNAKLWAGVADVAREHDINLICLLGNPLHSTRGFEAQANVLFDLVSDAVFDGLVVWGGALSHHAGIEAVERMCARYQPLPMVSLNAEIEGIPSMSVDNYQGMYDTVVHLIKIHGYRRIAFVRGPAGHQEAEKRYQAYSDALAEYSLPFDPALVIQGDFQRTTGAAAIRNLSEASIKFDALAAANDAMAIGAIEALQARGVNVPSDIAVVGLDDIEEAACLTPPLTTAPNPFYEQGRRITEMLLALMKGEQVTGHVVVATDLIVRQSCGCPNPVLAQPIVPEAAVSTDHSFQAALATRRAEIVSEIAQVVEGSPSAHRWAEQLLEAFSARSQDNFLPTLDSLLRQTMATGQDITTWHAAIAALWRQAWPYLDSQARSARAESLWQQAHMLIGDFARRTRAYQDLQADQQAQIANEFSQNLVVTYDIDDLMETLALGLPQLGIPSGYLALYENPQSPVGSSRLIMAYDQHGRLEVSEEQSHFPSSQLVPQGLLPSDRRYSLAVEALYFRKDQLGFAVFEAGPRQEKLCNMLRGQISSALQGALLVEQQRRQTIQLQTAAQVAQAASSVTEPQALIQHVVELARERFGLYYAGLFLVDESGEWSGEPGRWAMLRAGTGEAGREMLERGHKLEIGGDSMIGRCVATRQARIALDVGEEAVRFSNPLLPDTHSEMALPLISRERAIGALTIQSSLKNAFSEQDIAVLQTMAGQVANAIENARLYEQAQARAEQERLVRTITDKIRRSPNTETIMRTTLHELGAMLGASRSVIRLGSKTQLLQDSPEFEAIRRPE
ncbi:MAG: substrate-binding domain-containing protein [Thermoflexales bacterium]|nr:substrate-binding domain-containing protein [Thermoflexales bacterium]